jgi:hypothetical protein
LKKQYVLSYLACIKLTDLIRIAMVKKWMFFYEKHSLMDAYYVSMTRSFVCHLPGKRNLRRGGLEEVDQSGWDASCVSMTSRLYVICRARGIPDVVDCRKWTKAGGMLPASA